MRSFDRSLPMALLRSRESVMARFRPSLREHDLTEQQWRVLRALSAAGTPLTMSEIAERTLISLPSLSRLLRTLEERRLARRKAHAGDQRATQITLATAGARLVKTIAPVSEAIYQDISDCVGADNLERLYEMLTLLESRLREP